MGQNSGVLEWSTTPTNRNRTSPDVTTETFHLSKLAQQRLLDNTTFGRFQVQTGLADFYWEASYYHPPHRKTSLLDALVKTDGFVIFLHGWNGNHRIWEDLPTRLIQAYPNLVCLNLDIHGFGQSPFIKEKPPIHQATLQAAMTAVESWLELINLRPTPYRATKPFYMFVGHSMGGGIIFYKDQPQWQNETYGCYMMSPSMLYHEIIRRLLFQLVGWSILIPYVTPIKNMVAQLVIWFAMNEASRRVKWEHGQYEDPFDTLSATLLGVSQSPKPSRTDWSQFRLVLGNRDMLVNPKLMLNFVEKLGFTPDQIRMVIGDHYFLSYDETSPISHKYNREIVLADLVAFCQQLSKKAAINLTCDK
ncbi:alpha/beta hydrolase [Anaerolineales bacterium HSG24]|nr:alpha/beta hydrolase [Anaerolineales bacterium HSG24]